MRVDDGSGVGMMLDFWSVILLALTFAVALAWMGANPYSNDDE